MGTGDRTRNGDGDSSPAEFVALLDPSERLVLSIREELYGGSWEDMVEDLEARLAGKPYIFKLSQRIEKDLASIRKLRDFESRTGVDLAGYL